MSIKKEPASFPYISVIIPIFNGGKHLSQCLNSVLTQSFSDLEVICINDGSTDNTLNILEQYKKKDSRVTIYSQNNLGAGSSRNRGISVAKGKYIHFLDSDDWLEPDAYKILVDKTITKEHDMIFFNENIINTKNNKMSTKQYPFDEMRTYSFLVDYKTLIYGPVMVWNKLFLRSFIIHNHLLFDQLPCANDRFFYFSAIKCSNDIIFTNNSLINYRIGNDSSLTGDKRSKDFKCHFDSLDNILDYYCNENTVIKSMIVDVCIADMFWFFDKSKKRYQIWIYHLLHRYFQTFNTGEFDTSLFHWFDRFLFVKTNGTMRAICKKLLTMLKLIGRQKLSHNTN